MDMKKLFTKVENQENYTIIPQWAESFIQIGKKVAVMQDLGYCNIVIGFSVPTRIYAMLFFLLGYESWHSKKEFMNFKHNDSYFQNISECEKDEALLFLENGRWKRCWFRGIETIDDNKFVKVDVPGAARARHIRYVSMPKILTLRKAVDPERKVAANQTGFGMMGFNTLVQYYNREEHEILQFLIEAKPSYVLFGNKTKIKKEIKQVDLFFISDNGHMSIPIQHILRFKNFMSGFDFSRGNILSSKEYGESDVDISKSPIVIYDNSLAYLDRVETFQNKTEIIFLDRTETQFSNACSELMTRYYDRKDDVQLLKKKHTIFEVIAFKE